MGPVRVIKRGPGAPVSLTVRDNVSARVCAGVTARCEETAAIYHRFDIIVIDMFFFSLL